MDGSMPISRYNIINYNTEFTIWNVQQSDEGDYLCRASNANGAQDHIIQIDVQGEIAGLNVRTLPLRIVVTVNDNAYHVVTMALSFCELIRFIWWISNSTRWLLSTFGPRWSAYSTDLPKLASLILHLQSSFITVLLSSKADAHFTIPGG